LKIAAALFDLDGTLVDTLAICYKAFRAAVFASNGPSLTDAEIHNLFGPSEDGMMKHVFPGAWEDALDLYFAEYERLLPTCAVVVPELLSVVRLLQRRDVRTAVVTGKSRVSAMMSLRHFGIEEAFEAVETGSPTGVVKAEAIARILNDWKIERAAAIYVGDGAVDMRAAREAGVLAVGAAWAFGARAAELEPAGANLIFTDVREFATWLRSNTVQ
jgi:phosphoglycolate phosphatase-like HAD superfamily hydrolase